MSGEYGAIFILVGIIGLTVFFSAPAGSIAGKDAVDTTSAFHLVRREYQTDGVLVVHGRDGALLGEFGLVDNQLYETPAQARDGQIVATLRRDYYLLDPSFDLGTWAGYCTQEFDGERTDIGLRYSPIRLLYGTVAPDIIAGEESVGFGFSVFPPARLVGNRWRHLGIGAWYAAPYDGGDPGLVFGLSFSTH